MAAGLNQVQVEIFGQTYRLRSEDDPDYVESLASIVDAKMRDIARQTHAVDSLKVAVLTALTLADESRRAAAARTDAPHVPAADEAGLEGRVDDLVSFLDGVLQA